MSGPHQTVSGLLAACDGPDANATWLLCSRHPADALAFTVIGPDLTSSDLTFGQLEEASGRFAAGLASLGIGEGDRVATLMGKSADLVVTLLAIWRLGAVHVPLFTAFAPPAIAMRITDNGTKAVVVDPAQRDKLAPGGPFPADAPWHVITAGPASGTDIAFADLMTPQTGAVQAPVPVGGGGTLIELFTSGTTGTPKAVPIPLRAVAGFHSYQLYGLDHREDDVFWNAADPGWAYGLYYAIAGPLAAGRRSLLLAAPFSPELTWQVLTRFGVTNFTAGPTVYRALRTADTSLRGELRLRHCSSAGEPLTPDVTTWARSTLGVPVHDHYGQTETGMTIGNAWHPDLIAPLKSGSMGRALPGWTMDVLRADADEPASWGETGRVAVDVPASPLMFFTGYRDAPERSTERFTGDGRWYLTGDTAAKDTDGYFTFGSRDDDVILMAGYRIGPFEVESVLSEHPSVAEVAVVGERDELRGEVVVAYIVAQTGVETGEALAEELQQLVKTKLAAHAYPRRVRFVDALPKTPSGKIQRFLLRQASA